MYAIRSYYVSALRLDVASRYVLSEPSSTANVWLNRDVSRITSYNVCYTKLLRMEYVAGGSLLKPRIIVCGAGTTE